MSSPVRDVLQTLHKHSDVVESSLTGVVTADDATPGAAIVSLRQASALRPAGDEGYRLHPRLREYLQDHLQLYPAFQSLAEIGSRITHVQSLWTEIELLHRSDFETVSGLIASLQTSAFDILESMTQNMLLLHTLLSTRFGHVKSMRAKKAQNRFYQKQSSQLALDVQLLSKVADTVEREASERSLEEVAQFLRKNILSKISGWQHGLSEIQTQIRKEIFSIREVEENLKHLARMDMLLRQQPAWTGFEIDMAAEIPDFMLLAKLPRLVANIDPTDSDPEISKEMESVASTLPEKPTVVNEEPPQKFKRIRKEKEPVPKTPAWIAMEELAKDVGEADAGVSLGNWRESNLNAQTMDRYVWMVFAVMALRAQSIKVILMRKDARPGEKFRHELMDAMAFGPKALPKEVATR